jgi:hypothetical protein
MKESSFVSKARQPVINFIQASQVFTITTTHTEYIKQQHGSITAVTVIYIRGLTITRLPF